MESEQACEYTRTLPRTQLLRHRKMAYLSTSSGPALAEDARVRLVQRVLADQLQLLALGLVLLQELAWGNS